MRASGPSRPALARRRGTGRCIRTIDNRWVRIGTTESRKLSAGQSARGQHGVARASAAPGRSPMIGRTSARRGFSLIDLIVVAVIGLIGIGILLPALQGVRAVDHSKKTMNNLKVIGFALHNCNDAHKKLPPAFGPFGVMKFNAPLHVHLLPFEGQENPGRGQEEIELYNAYLQNEGKGDTAERLVAVYRAEEESLAGDKSKGAQNFAANLLVFSDKFRAIDYDKNGKDLEGVHKCSIGFVNGFPDGWSNTVVAATKFAVCGEGGSRYAGELSGKFAAFFGQNAAQKP